MKKYKYNINNLDCANCAREIEDSLNKNKDFKNVCVNFNTSKLMFESNKDFNLNELNKLIKKVEPDIFLSIEEVSVNNYNLTSLIIGTVLTLLAYILPFPNVLKLVIYIISYFLLLYKTFFNALKLLIKNKTINENALISISAIGALCIGEVSEGMMVIVLYNIGKILEEKAVNNSRNSIKNILSIKEPYANKKINNNFVKVNVEDININDILCVKKGEKVPVDGVLISNRAILDSSLLTGESELVQKAKKDTILSGCINNGDTIEIKATTKYEDSTVAKILDLIENATNKKTKTETTVTKISKVYTPLIMIIAIIIVLFLPQIINITYIESLYRGLTFLVISCPCAIAISVPLSYFTAIGTASKNGILIKGSNYLDNLNNVKNIIFDKTGTLTNGSFNIENIKIYDKKYKEDDIINLLITGESLSNHPISKSILNYYKKTPDTTNVTNFKEHEGKGLSYEMNNDKVIIGNNKLCKCKNDVSLHINVNNKHIASIIINDGIKDNAKEVINRLKACNIKTFMFTGDKKDIALATCEKLNIDKVYYEMLPQDKYDEYSKIAKNNNITIFVGDGINDAPVLKRADVGISMGSIGSDAAIEASDIVLMNDDLSKITKAIEISKYNKNIIKQNLIFALGIKTLILILSVCGLANMWFAVFADTGLTLLTILNSLRITKL